MTEPYSIEWHKECVSNIRRNYFVLREFISIKKEELQNLEAQIEFYEFQIREAERKKKKKFAPDRFMKSRRPK